ncbi:MAG: LysM peptidoglycan-binding domain-containing protein [Bacteroidales bacterium]
MRTILISLLAFLFVTGSLYAQTTQQIEVSTEKINENGVVKYVHHVKKGETMYSLSKAYGVTTEEIINSNPNLKSGLQMGMIVFIPTVRQKDSAKLVNNDKTKATTDNNDRYKKYVVKWYETIEEIADKFNVSMQDLMSLNKLTSTKLAKRQVLLIPNKGDTTVKQEEPAIIVAQEIPNDIIIKEEESIKEELNKDKGNIVTAPLGPIKLSVILPLNSRDSANLNFNFMDFYAGSLLAINKLKEQGISLELNVYDQKAYSSIKNLTSTGVLNTSQLIIGPVRGRNIEEILPFSVQNNIPIISPMDQSAEQYIHNNPYLIHTPTSTNKQIENLVVQLKLDYVNAVSNGGANVLLCYEKGIHDTASVRATKMYLNAAGIAYTTISYGILEGRAMLGKINSSINRGKHNLVIIPSNSEAFVSDFVRNLNLCLQSPSSANSSNLETQHSISLYGLPKWRNFETIEPDYFHKMNLHLALPYYIDYDNEEVKEFLFKFRALYKAEPSPYAYQGYDIAKYFVNMLNKYGKDFINVIETQNEKMLQSNYSFSRKDNTSGFENNATRNVKYNPDYSITVIN